MRHLISGSIIALITLIFALQNADKITLRLLLWDIQNVSLALVIMLALLIGIMLGLMFMAGTIYQKSKVISDQKKQIELLEKERPAQEDTETNPEL